MKIVVASTYKIDSETGVAFVSNDLVRALSIQNEVLYICLGERYSFTEISNKLSILKIPSIDIGRATIPLITPDVMIKVFDKLDNFHPDIIHTQNSILNSKLVQMWANINSVPLVVTFHHIPTESIEHIVPKLSKYKFAKIIQEFYVNTNLKKFIKDTGGVIALNENIKNSIRQIDKNIKIKIINNGLDLDNLFKIKTNTVNLKKINFLFVGSYTERKNQKYLIQVFSHLPESYQLICHGKKKTGGEYLHQLNNLLTSLNVKNVILNDYTDNLVKIYKKADYFVTASIKEAQSLAVIQALAAGKPVIGIENETTLEIINNSNGLVVPKQTTPENFAKKIIKLVNKNNYKKMSSNARRTSFKFDIKKVVPKIEKFYKSLSK